MTSPATVANTSLPVADAAPAHAGVPLRDWFAGQALVGLIPSPARPGVLPLSATDMARLAYQYADAMMRQRGT
jgi:hypothetical protein